MKENTERAENIAESKACVKELDFLRLQKIRLRHTAPLSKKEKKSSALLTAY
jgi:hypothetical protein